MKSSPHRPSIELLFKRGLGSAEIARRLQISSSTVRNVVAAIKKRGDASEVKKSGRPRSVNTRNTRAIIKKRIIRNDGLSLNRMASQLGIARSTVQSIVKNDLKLKSYKLRRGQYLSDKSKAMRLEKCRKLLQHFQPRPIAHNDAALHQTVTPKLLNSQLTATTAIFGTPANVGLSEEDSWSCNEMDWNQC
uniref:HTH luxR-type domain-containing protein n=1 Tax=Caenorhabditis japonica TaxID=281687 RepID=A0A8R1EWX2_CAEJA